MLVERRLVVLWLLLLWLLSCGGDIWRVKKLGMKVLLYIVIVARLIGGSCEVVDATKEVRI